MVVMKQNQDEVNQFKALFKDELEADVLGFTEFLNYHQLYLLQEIEQLP